MARFPIGSVESGSFASLRMTEERAFLVAWLLVVIPFLTQTIGLAGQALRMALLRNIL
jgi:hypothetical protein